MHSARNVSPLESKWTEFSGWTPAQRVEKKLERPWKLEIIRDQRLTTVVGRAIREIPANKSFRRQLKQSRSAELVVMSTTNGDI
jgi:hypothetical protein